LLSDGWGVWWLVGEGREEGAKEERKERGEEREM
jgi:hypothetical protein